MKIALYDVDSHHFPNLALMKLSAYHKKRGDSVEWWNGLTHYDIAYQAKVFTEEYSPDADEILNADQVITGGTGYSISSALSEEIEHCTPDYSLYPEFQETAYGFLTRGCPRNCPFCIVSQKEGRCSKKVSDLSEFWTGQKEIKLLDPNLLASTEHEALLVQLAESQARVDFTQGLDIRLVTSDNIPLLNRVKTKTIHFAWDNPTVDLTGKFEWYANHAKLTKHRKPCVYVLTNYDSTHEQDLYRVYALRDLGFDPYIMIYNKSTAPKETRHLQRWCNNRIVFNAQPDFSKYDPKRA